MVEIQTLFKSIRRLHERIRDIIVKSCELADLENLSRVVKDTEGDTIYEVDRISEKVLVEFFEYEVAPQIPIILIAEGIENGKIVLPRGTSEADAKWRIIVDPIDGTRGIMYQKRSAWILTGVAQNRGSETNLQDIVFAIQTEIPIIKQHLSDVIWAFTGQGVNAKRFNRLTGENISINLKPSGANTISHGFAMISRFFPGAREELAAIDEEIVFQVLGPVQAGKAHCFEDQYICTSGQIYELISGHDRFVADLRPFVEKILLQRGLELGICCHPYDICTELIAREAGVIVTKPTGQSLDAPLDTATDVAWVGYANARIRSQIEPVLQRSLKSRGLL